MNSYEELRNELHKVYRTYKGDSGQYFGDLRTLEVVVGDLTFSGEITDVSTYKDNDGANRDVMLSLFTIGIRKTDSVHFGTLVIGGGGRGVPVDEIRFQDPSKLFQELPAEYKTEEGAKLLSQLFKEATKALQCTQDYTKWLANL